jgi:hypothetical protein
MAPTTPVSGAKRPGSTPATPGTPSAAAKQQPQQDPEQLAARYVNSLKEDQVFALIDPRILKEPVA